jgi:RNA polymerase sigma-70 factor (ECF subfamily)
MTAIVSILRNSCICHDVFRGNMESTGTSTSGSTASMSDAQLVEKARQGDQAALSALLTRYRPVVERQLQRFPIAPHDRADLVQDALLQVIRRLHTFRGDAQFSTWLYRVTANAALMRMRSDRRRRSASLDDHLHEIEQSVHATAFTSCGEWAERADHRIEEQRRRRMLEEAIAALPEPWRIVVLEHYVEGSALQALADRLHTTESSVRSRLHRARTALRERLREAA